MSSVNTSAKTLRKGCLVRSIADPAFPAQAGLPGSSNVWLTRKTNQNDGSSVVEEIVVTNKDIVMVVEWSESKGSSGIPTALKILHNGKVWNFYFGDRWWYDYFEVVG